MDEILEELYELLDLYFRIGLGSGFVKAGEQLRWFEPTLNYVECKEDILEKILERSQKLHSLL